MFFLPSSVEILWYMILFFTVPGSLFSGVEKSVTKESPWWLKDIHIHHLESVQKLLSYASWCSLRLFFLCSLWLKTSSKVVDSFFSSVLRQAHKRQTFSCMKFMTNSLARASNMPKRLEWGEMLSVVCSFNYRKIIFF